MSFLQRDYQRDSIGARPVAKPDFSHLLNVTDDGGSMDILQASIRTEQARDAVAGLRGSIGPSRQHAGAPACRHFVRT